MIGRRGLLTGWLVGCLAAGGVALAADTPEDAAQTAAESWLKLVDGGSYGASWEQAAKLFKAAVDQPRWVQMVEGVRPPLGKLASRTLKSREYTEKMPGAPDGKYVVVKYDTVFEKKATSVETLVVMMDPDAAWRVSGYLIQ